MVITILKKNLTNLNIDIDIYTQKNHIMNRREHLYLIKQNNLSANIALKVELLIIFF